MPVEQELEREREEEVCNTRAEVREPVREVEEEDMTEPVREAEEEDTYLQEPELEPERERDT